jgi:hypothetical protein
LGAYRPAHRTSDAKRHMKAQLAVREALVRTRTRYIALVSALVRREGLRVADGEAESFVKRVAALALPGWLMEEVAPLLSLMLHLNEQIAFMNGVLDRRVNEFGVAAFLEPAQDLALGREEVHLLARRVQRADGGDGMGCLLGGPRAVLVDEDHRSPHAAGVPCRGYW